MTAHQHPAAELTRNQALVYGALSKAEGPLSAYTILDRLREDGFRAPLQVYRALDKLVEIGVVHRLESLNAFVACRHPEDETHETVAFAICEECGMVSELPDDRLGRQLKSRAKDVDFALTSSTIELRGVCGACREAGQKGDEASA